MASAAVVDAVGARPSGQASSRTDTSSETSAALDSPDPGCPVITISGTASRLIAGVSATSSAVSPL